MDTEDNFVANCLAHEKFELQKKCNSYEAALELIAAPKRPDGTYNRCREACEKLAKDVLQFNK